MSIVKINALTVPEGHGEELEKRFEARKHVVDNAPGFEGFQLLRPVAGETRYFVVTQWADEESYQAWRDGDERKAGKKDDAAAHDGDKKPVAKSFELLEFEVVLGSQPKHA
ncbi:MAG: antibiotic biosynthesis monooxygenase [Corynebacterium sp.]|nr:antibiotic biosynthesis monooxygenase [Corynebacterium sp.]